MSELPFPLSNSDFVGPVTVSHESPREQLLAAGEVIIFRTSERTTGETWWRRSVTGTKIGDCQIEFLCSCDPANDAELSDHVELSGYDSIPAWRSAIREIHEGNLPAEGLLYHVTSEASG
jgi:hypothetical protein